MMVLKIIIGSILAIIVLFINYHNEVKKRVIINLNFIRIIIYRIKVDLLKHVKMELDDKVVSEVIGAIPRMMEKIDKLTENINQNNKDSAVFQTKMMIKVESLENTVKDVVKDVEILKKNSAFMNFFGKKPTRFFIIIILVVFFYSVAGEDILKYIKGL